MSRKRFTIILGLAAVFMVMLGGCRMASEPEKDGTKDISSERIPDAADIEDMAKKEEMESESMKDAQEDKIAEAIKQETAQVEPETDQSQDAELTEGEPTAEIGEIIPVKYISQRFSECGTIETISYTTFDYFGDGSEIEKHANVYLPYGYDEEKQYNVLYLMHGIGGDENEWGMNGNDSRVKIIMDNLI